MSDKSAIEWTDATWNPTTGCDQISPGCAHCYAKTWAARGLGNFAGGRPFEDVRTHDDRLEAPLRWKRGRRIFVDSMSDLFHADVPDAFIDRVFAVMALARQHTFQILTKRADRMRAYMTAIPWPARQRWREAAAAITSERRGNVTEAREHVDRNMACLPLPNVWLGVSAENQHFADARIPLLLQTPAAIRFISAEPLLGPVSLRAPMNRFVPLGQIMHGADGLKVNTLKGVGGSPGIPALDWVIVGGESGPGARPFDVAWARSIVAQCQAAGVPVFVKQLGAHAIDGHLTAKELIEGGAGRPRPFDQPLAEAEAAALLGDLRVAPMNRQLPLRNRKGGDMAEWPEDLRVREFPRAAVPV